MARPKIFERIALSKRDLPPITDGQNDNSHNEAGNTEPIIKDFYTAFKKQAGLNQTNINVIAAFTKNGRPGTDEKGEEYTHQYVAFPTLSPQDNRRVNVARLISWASTGKSSIYLYGAPEDVVFKIAQPSNNDDLLEKLAENLITIKDMRPMRVVKSGEIANGIYLNAGLDDTNELLELNPNSPNSLQTTNDVFNLVQGRVIGVKNILEAVVRAAQDTELNPHLRHSTKE